MSLYGMMRTGVSGMAAQANRLSTVADNIANSGTTGYKRSSIEFSSMLMPGNTGSYNSGGVTSNVLHTMSQGGTLQYTTSASDLAVDGNGFFVVRDAAGSPFMTRAGAFVPDATGRLVNAAGFQLMAYNFENGAPAPTLNGFEGLEPVVITDTKMAAVPSTSGNIAGNLPAGAATVAAGSLPSTNAANAEYSAKRSLVTYDNVGNKLLLDVYFTKTGANTWEATVYNQADATAGTSFPYSSAALGTSTLTFDQFGALASNSATGVSLTVPNGQPFQLDLSELSQLANDFTVSDASSNGNAPSSIKNVEISTDGTIYAKYTDGSIKALYKIALATVTSPDKMTTQPGNVYSQSVESGTVRIGFANQGGMGSVVSGALESSNVDIATELTDMIEAQRSYTANSKVFQTGADLMDILVNLKR